MRSALPAERVPVRVAARPGKYPIGMTNEEDLTIPPFLGNRDYTDDLPDECLALIFQCLSSGDQKKYSLVCRRWILVEGQSHQRLSLNIKVEILPHVPAMFSHFDSVTKLSLRCDRKSVLPNLLFDVTGNW
ncbi:F-box protein [Capsicum chinense]|nr:F-box protein [Capsicum chinense]